MAISISHLTKRFGQTDVLRGINLGVEKGELVALLGPSSRQARSILEGLPADLVTFNQETDIDVLAQGGLLPAEWRDLLPNGASPWYSLPAFLVREGNPKDIQDWDDLARDDVSVIFPNPRTSGNARYTYLAAFA